MDGGRVLRIENAQAFATVNLRDSQYTKELSEAALRDSAGIYAVTLGCEDGPLTLVF